mmetsp:Transcript_8945/g.25983  ORF Transcript_8945/g.25983 Transcript_8945/m.25983 type:complete len:238 (+) Transcript_8945:44-757(+)
MPTNVMSWVMRKLGRSKRQPSREAEGQEAAVQYPRTESDLLKYGAFCLPEHIPRDVRAASAIAIMEANFSGELWISTCAPPYSIDDSLLTPIKWRNADGRKVKMGVRPEEDQKHHLDLSNDGSPKQPKEGTNESSVHCGAGHASRRDEPASTGMPPLDPAPAPPGTEPSNLSGSCCVICMDSASNIRLLPCQHDQFCRRCILESICVVNCLSPPSCPLCRAPFHTMMLFNPECPPEP